MRVPILKQRDYLIASIQSSLTDADLANIPSLDLPAGIPPWMYDVDGWAKRAGANAAEKRVNITVTVPAGVITVA